MHTYRKNNDGIEQMRSALLRPIKRPRLTSRLALHFTVSITTCLTLCILRPSPANASNVLIQKEINIDTDLKPSDVIHWDSVSAITTPSGKISVGIRLRTEQQFTLYTDKVVFTPPPGFILESMTAPPSRSHIDPVMGKTVEVYYGGSFSLIFKRIDDDSDLPEVFDLAIRYLGCTTRICLFPFTETISFKVFGTSEIQNGNEINQKDKLIHPFESLPVTSTKKTDKQQSGGTSTTQIDSNQANDQQPNPATTPTPEGEGLEATLLALINEGTLPTWMILLLIFLSGVITNLTPCVYPMIPITIRVLAGQSKSPLAASSAYASGILITYTGLGVFAALTGSLFGTIMASPTFNLIFGFAMFAFAIGMLGFGNFSSIQTVGNRLGSGQASLKNAFFMGTGAGLVASPCTGPVLAFLIAYSAKQSDAGSSILMLFIYSLGFALPYVFLGGLAAKAASIKVSPRVQISVKAVFAAVMFALGLYYLRIPAYGLLKSMADTWPVIAKASLITGAISMIVALLYPRFYERKHFLILPSLVLGFGIFSGSQWLTTSQTLAAGKNLHWIKSESEGLAIAKTNHAPVLIDAWAEWCEACKKMDGTTFSDPRVIQILNDSNFVTIKIDLTQPSEENDLLMEKYEIRSLPTLTLLKKGGDQKNKTSILGFVSSAVLINKIHIFNKEK